MAETLGLEQNNNYEVKIYVETAKEIFERCLSRANISGKSGMAILLEKAIDAAFSDNKLDAKYLRNTYNKIHKLNSPYEKIGIYHISIYTLARFAGINDYMTFNENFGPKGIMVMYTEKPYALLNFMRIVRTGNLSRINWEWEYKDDDLSLKANISGLQLYTMPGDQKPGWIEVTYDLGQQQRKCYFADLPASSAHSALTVQSEQSRLFIFFNKLLKDNPGLL